MREDAFERVRRALKGVGRDLLDYMYDAPDDVLTEWLKAPFERAASAGDIPLTIALMEAGARGNALGSAVTGGHRRLVRDLLERGASHTDKNEDGDTPLHLAAKFGHGFIVRTLLIEGADMDAVDKLGRTPLHLSSINGDVVGLQALLTAGSDVNHRHSSTNFSPLDMAAYNGKVEALTALLRKGADVNARGERGMTALHTAAERGQAEATRILAKATGVEIDCKDDVGRTPLHLAASEGNLHTVEALVAAGADVSLRVENNYAVDYEGLSGDCSALDFAAFGGHVNVMKLLVRHGAGVRDTSHNSRLLTALHHAAAGTKLDAMEFLMGSGADAKAGALKWKPIHFATEANSPEAVLALVRHGADLHAEDSLGRPPLSCAADRGNMETLNALLLAGADPNISHEVCPPLLFVVLSRSDNSEDMTRALLQHGADVNELHDYETAINEAARYGNVGVVKLLLDAGALVDGHKDFHGLVQAPLHAACTCSLSCDVVKVLLGHGANVNLQDSEGTSALHLAAVRFSSRLVDLLLRQGADETTTNGDGNTPADCVRLKAGHQEDSRPVLRLLDGAPADRAWRRRGLVLLCRTPPQQKRLGPGETRTKTPRVPAGEGAATRGGISEGGSDAHSNSNGSSDFSSLMARVFYLPQGVLRKIVCYL